LSANGNANVGNLGTAGLITATGNIGGGNINTAGQLVSSVATGTAPLVVTSTTQVANLSVATAGTVTTNAQPNITSVGTLTSLGVNGAITSTTYTSNIATGTAPLVITSTTQVGNLYVARAGVADTVTVSSTSAGNYYFSLLSSTSGNLAPLANSVFVANAANGAITATTFVGSLSGSATTAGTVTTNAQPNITSTGTLTSVSVSGNANIGNIGTGGLITATGNITGGNIIASNYHIRSVGTGISAAGATQGTATSLTKEINIVSTVASGAGVKLPTAVAGMVINIVNTSANSLLVYPDTNGIINAQAANVAYTLPTLGSLQFISSSTTQWYTVGSSYA
jgi:hypothetical protein